MTMMFITLVPLQMKGSWFKCQLGPFCVVLSVQELLFSTFLPQSKNLLQGVSVRMCGCEWAEMVSSRPI